MRFSLRTLLLVSTLLAFLFAALFALPAIAAASLAFFLLGAVPAGLACCVYFGSGNIKAFSMGALVPILPNTFLVYCMVSPAFIVLEKINWWNGRGKQTNALESFDIIYQRWDFAGYAMLASQAPVWIAAILSGFCAVAVSRWVIRLKCETGTNSVI